MADSARYAIRYEVTIDDLVAYNVFHARTSPTVNALQRRYAMITLPLIFVTMLLLGTIMRHTEAFYPWLLATLITAGMAAYLRYYFKRGYVSRVRDMARKLYSEDKNPGTLGEHVLEVDELGFSDRTEYKESRYAWGALVRVESEADYTYLFTGAMTAFVIPHKAIAEGDFPGLLEQVRLHYRPEAKLAVG